MVGDCGWVGGVSSPLSWVCCDGVLTGDRVSSVELWYLHQADWEHAVEEAEMRLKSDEAQHGVEFK